MRTVTIWLLIFLPGVIWAADTKKLFGTVGKPLELKCPYGKNQKHEYYWCKGAQWHLCSNLEHSSKSQKRGKDERVLITHHWNNRESTMVLKDLTLEDSGIYWCWTKKKGPVVMFTVSVSSNENRETTPATSKGLTTASPASPIPATTVRNEITSNSVQTVTATGGNEDLGDLLRPVLIAASLFGVIFLGALCAWIILSKRRKFPGTDLVKQDVGARVSNQYPLENLENTLYVAAEMAAAKEQDTFYTMIGHLPSSAVREHFYEEIQGQYCDVSAPTCPIVRLQPMDAPRNGCGLRGATDSGGYSMVMAPGERQDVR